MDKKSKKERVMDIFGILTFAGGLAMFLFGMHMMGEALSKRSGSRLERIVEKFDANRPMAVLLGIVVTALIQSSSATTVMVVGFVNSGIMTLTQAVGIIMGANVGTTVTSWLLSLTGIDSGNVFVKLLKPSSFAPILAMIGVFMILSKKEGKRRDTGRILVGFAILMFGMDTMSGAVKPLAQNERFTGILTAFSHPLPGMLAGLILTAIIQSSSASVGILQALCVTGAVGYKTAIPIILGQNIGTCVTALLSSVGAGTNAKRASMIHLYFNLIGTLIFMLVFYGINALVGGFAFLAHPANAAGIALWHSLFNIGALLLLYPFADRLVALAKLTVKDNGKRGKTVKVPLLHLDERFFERPSFAMERCRSAACVMADETKKCLFRSLSNISDYSRKNAEAVRRSEQLVDTYEDAVGTYLVKLNSCDLSQADSHTLTVLLHCISDFERIADRALAVTEDIRQMLENDLSFSKKAMEEIAVFSDALEGITEETIGAFCESDLARADRIEPFEQVIESISLEMKKRHIRRVREGKCTIELGFILEDIITNFEQISAHCSNIAVCMLRINEDEFDTHGYLGKIRNGHEPWFEEEYKRLSAKYALPQQTIEIL
jgi:phosphate:Na+ symporter